jgi:hypothetical protein
MSNYVPETLLFAELQRQADELQVRNEELTRDRRAMDAEREAMFHQQAIERRHFDEQQAEVRRLQKEIQRDLDRKVEDERQRVFAERKAEDDLLAQIAADEAQAALAAKLNALKPDIQKAERFAADLDAWAAAYLNVIGVLWADSALVLLEQACNQNFRNVERGDFCRTREKI